MKTFRLSIVLVSIALAVGLMFATLAISETAQASAQNHNRLTKIAQKLAIWDSIRHKPNAPGDLAYVTLSGSNMVALVDTTTHTVTGSVDVGASGCYFPWRATMSPDGNYVYVSCYSSGNVAVIETSGNTVVTIIGGIPSADGIAFRGDGAYAMVGSRWNNQIAVVDTATYLVSFLSTSQQPRSIAAHPYLDIAYATCGDGTILVIDTSSFSILTSIPFGSDPWDIAVSPDGKWVFASDRQGAGLAVIDALNNTLYTTVTGLGDLNGLDILPDGSEIYVSGMYNEIHVIDGNTFSLITTIASNGSNWEVASNCNGSEIYVGNNSNQVPIIDTTSYTVTQQITMPGYSSREVVICPQKVASGLILSPSDQTNPGTRGQVVAHEEVLVNATGTTDSFTLTLGSRVWDTALSTDSLGPIADGDLLTFTVYVTVPVGVDWYLTDTAIVTATSVASPTIYSDTASFTTQAYAPPEINISPDVLTSTQFVHEIVTETATISNGNGVTLTFETSNTGGSGCEIVSGQSEHTTNTLDDIYSNWGQSLAWIYLYGYSEDNDTLYARVTASTGTDNWDILYEGEDGTRLILDQEFDPITYSQVRIELVDTEANDIIYYDYSFEWCSQNSWLFADPISGTVGSNNSQPVSVIFDATNLQPNTYHTRFTIHSNDPTTPTVSIPVTMTVQPAASMGWVEGYITDARTSDPLDATVIAQGQPYTITTEPDTGYYQFWLEAGNYTLQASAEGYVTETRIINITAQAGITEDFPLVLDVPVLEVTPDNLESTQQVGETTTQSITITNAGPTELTYQISEHETTDVFAILDEYARTDEEVALLLDKAVSTVDLHNPGIPSIAPFPTEAFQQLQGPVRILAWTLYTDYYQEYQNTLNAIAQYTNFTVIETTTTDPATLAGLLANADIFLIPEQEDTNYTMLFNIGISWTGILGNFIGGGGTVIAMDHCNQTTGLVEGAGLMDLTYYGCDSGDLLDMVVTNHPLAHGVSATFASLSGTGYYDYTNGQEIIQRQSNGMTVVSIRDIGSGHVVMMGFDFYNYNDDMARLIANAVQWYDGDIPWLSTIPITGTVPAYSSMPVQVNFDATGLQPDTYTGNININSNDPFTPTTSVEVTMNVQPTSDMGQVTGTVFDAWSTAPLTATVELVGVYSMTASPDYSIWATAGSYSITAYAPGYYTETWSVEIISGGITIQDIYLEPGLPRLEYAPDAIPVTAVEGHTAMQTLVISNTGPISLDFSIHEIDPSVTRLSLSPEGLDGKRILYDQAHGEPSYLDYSALIIDIQNEGAELTVNYTATVDATLLDSYDVLWVNCCGYTNWTFDELTAVANWLDQGGAVLIQGEESPATSDLAEIFGITYQYGSCASGTTTNILSHPISAGVSAVYVDYTCRYLDAGVNADIVVYDTQNQVHVVSHQENGGKMVVVANEDFIDWQIDNDDNRLLANNILSWLADPGYSDVPWLSASPDEGHIEEHDSLNIQIGFDATSLSIGEYQAILAIEHNDPNQLSPIQLPVTLTVVSQEAGVSITPASQAQDGSPGETAEYTFTVVNQGNYTDTFNLEANGIWPPTISISSTGPIAAGESFTFTVSVAIPSSTLDESTDTCLIIAHSTFDPAVYASAQAVTTVVEHKIYLPLIVR